VDPGDSLTEGWRAAMQFCTRCGRPRDEGASFCVGCGNPFPGAPVVPPARPVQGPPVQGPPVQGPPSREPPPSGSLGWGPGPRESPPPYAAGQVSGDLWRPAGTTPPPGPPTEPPHGLDAILVDRPPAGAPAGPGEYRRPPGRPPWVLIALLLVVVVAGGGAAAVLLARGHGARPSSQATPSKPPATPTRTFGSPSASGPPGQGQVGVAAGVAGDTQTPQVVALLDRYFSAINSLDYQGFFRLLSPAEQQQTSQSQFDRGFASTKDSGETLQALSATPGGGVTATLTFTSHQNPADSINGHESCTDWRISLYLQPSGNGYLLGKPPPTYKAAYSAC
jgi:hypothetical protein